MIAIPKPSPRLSASRKRAFIVALSTAGILLSATPATYAANDLWIGNTDANFGTLANWTGSVTPNANTPEFGVAGTSGTTLNNDISSASYAGFIFDSGASAYTIGGNSFTLTGNITNNSTSTQTINNAITLNNAVHTVAATSGNLVLGGAFSGTTTRGITFTGTSTTTLSGTNAFNMNGGGSNSFYGFIVGTTGGLAGNVSITGATTVDGSSGTGTQFWGYLGMSGNSNLTVQSGASFTIKTSSAAGLNSGIGDNATGTTTLTVNGGSFSLNGNGGFMLGNNRTDATGVLTINSGTATITAGNTTLQSPLNIIAMGRDGANGIINLNGGTLATGRQFVRDGNSGGSGATGAGTGTANFNFNGGVLQAQANQTQGNGWFETATTGNFQVVTTTVKAGGAKIDTNGFNVNINTVLAHDSGLGSTADGGLTKIGAGTLTLGGANTYTGGTTVSAGTLALSGNFTMSGANQMTIAATGTAGTNYATLALTGSNTLNFGGTLAINFSSSILSGGETFNLFQPGSNGLFNSGFTDVSVTGSYVINHLTGSSGVWTGSASGFDFTFNESTGDLSVAASAVPEPATYAAVLGSLALGAVALNRRRTFNGS